MESINAGRYGYTTWEILGLFYQRALRHQPDLIILYSTFNDAQRYVSPYYSVDDDPQLYGNPALNFLNKHSALFAFMDFRLRFMAPKSIQTFYRRIVPTYAFSKREPQEHLDFIQDNDRRLAYLVEAYKRNVRTILWIARDNNVKVLLCTQMISKGYYRNATRPIDEALREVARKEGVPLLDSDAFGIEDPSGAGLLQTYAHMTPEGCEFLSDKMVEAILENDLLPSPSPTPPSGGESGGAPPA